MKTEVVTANPTRVVLMGHRGTGKTAFLKRIQTALASSEGTLFLDLDQMIEEKSKKTIPEIFATQGESAFRALERETFLALSNSLQGTSTSCYLAVGAGFIPCLEKDAHPDISPGSWKYWWLRRPTDAQGRIFLNRPRLDPNTSPLQEFKDRLPQREKIYSQWADESLILQEGFDFPDAAESAWINNSIAHLGGAVTVSAENLKTDEAAHNFFQRRKNWGLHFFELRDDLVSNEALARALNLAPKSQILLSFRRPENKEKLRTIQQQGNLAFDWPLEWGLCHGSNPTVLSYHQRESTIEKTLAKVRTLAKDQGNHAQIKLALPIFNFHELLQGHLWQQENPENHSFLPISDSGRWRWYRLWMKNRMPLQFWREGAGSAPDQPTLLEWLRQDEIQGEIQGESSFFAAVLGDPVEHSRTPAEHFDFFRKLGCPVFSIRLSREEWAQDSLQLLQTLGLRWAAVTSPLKDLAFQSSHSEDPITLHLKTTNTLLFLPSSGASSSLPATGRWLGQNTDVAGLKLALEKNIPTFAQLKFALWGGGGTLEMAKFLLPVSTTLAYSSQSGLPRTEEKKDSEPPDVVLWAVGRNHFDAGGRFPSAHWRPRWVLDMNYSEDSPGREYALRCGATYIGGLDMFRGQAEAQRQFWVLHDHP